MAITGVHERRNASLYLPRGLPCRLAKGVFAAQLVDRPVCDLAFFTTVLCILSALYLHPVLVEEFKTYDIKTYED